MGGCLGVGLYDVDATRGVVSSVVWSETGTPHHPIFPMTEAPTGKAISSRETVTVGDVLADPHYLTTFATTRSEIIVPVFDQAAKQVIGAIDIESETPHAFSRAVQTLLEACSELIRPLWKR
jgi:GAF domain-containing protein